MSRAQRRDHASQRQRGEPLARHLVTIQARPVHRLARNAEEDGRDGPRSTGDIHAGSRISAGPKPSVVKQCTPRPSRAWSADGDQHAQHQPMVSTIRLTGERTARIRLRVRRGCPRQLHPRHAACERDFAEDPHAEGLRRCRPRAGRPRSAEGCRSPMTVDSSGRRMPPIRAGISPGRERWSGRRFYGPRSRRAMTRCRPAAWDGSGAVVSSSAPSGLSRPGPSR